MALEVIDGAILSPLFQPVFQKLDSEEVKNFIRGKKQTDKLLKKLRIMLLSVDNVYDDAEEKQLTNPAVREWLGELKDAIFDAVDLLDEIKTEALRSEVEAYGSGSSTSTKVNQFISDSFHAFDESVDTKIEEIIESLDFIAQRKDALELKTGARQRICDTGTRLSTSLYEESIVYGRDEDKITIIKLLLANDETGNKIDVISIVGMGGIGKTTLAQLVYNDDNVTRHFDLRAWVCVSDDFDVVKITQIIMSAISQTNCDITDPALVQLQLKKALTGKKFLFVLDDVWNEKYEKWEFLRRPFESAACGSKIIVTTRNEGVASLMGTLHTHHLPDISDDDCWLLFAKHAFQNISVGAYPNLEVIGRKIVEKCKGLPLAAKSLGSLLRISSNEEDWKHVLESDIWELPEKECNILPALWLSYRYLPPHLKRCFAYSSIYPKDYEFDKNDLVLLWMAEDLLQPEQKKMVEEVGEDCFNDLVSRSLFQRAKGYDGRPVFTMHDLVSDLAKFVSGDFCVRPKDNDPFNDMSLHFSYMKNNLDLEKFEALYEAKCMRTSLTLSTWRRQSSMFEKVPPDLLLKFQSLRVLKLSGTAIRELPDSVSKLIHLRYLDLSYTKIEKLPDGVCGLYNLQTLLLTSCYYLAQLPTGLGRLIHLRHVDFRGTRLAKIPSEMCKLKGLRTLLLDKFDLDNETGNNILDLKELQELHGKLHISGLQNIVHAGDALGANMREKKYLTELVLEWGGDTDDSRKDQEVLDNLRPHTNIRQVTIDKYGGTVFPAWLGDDCFSNLVSVRLVKCANFFSLPAPAQFPALDKFELSDCPNLVRFPDGGLHAPNLVEIWIFGCKNLRSLPEEMRTLLPSLRIIQIYDCPELESFPEGGLPCKLEELGISNCEKLVENRMQWGLLELASLRELLIFFQNCEEEIDSFPEEGLLPTTLTELSFGYLSNLKTINSKELKRFISLQSLSIFNCPELLRLPVDGLPISLSDLTIHDCPLVTQRCEEDEGDNWPKIAHIPNKSIDNSSHFCFVKESKRQKESKRGTNMAESTSQLVLVRCPKCRLLLPELPDFQLYKCGGCGAILQGKGRIKAELVPSELHSPIKQVQRAREEDEIELSNVKEKVSIEEDKSSQELFPFCVLFPSDFEFRKHELVQLWIAADLNMKEREGETMEDAGIRHFDSLERKSFFVRSRCDFKLDFDSVFSVPMYSPSNFFYKVNPVELSVLENGISHAEYFRAVNGELDGASESTTKHLSLTYDDINEMTFGIIPKYKDLRTLLLLSGLGSSIKRVPGDLFLSLNFLTTLKLSRTLISGLPSSIGDVTPLKYLDVSYTPIRRLPESIGSLAKLQTLKLIGCKHLSDLPRSVQRLTALRHLDFDIIGQLDFMPAHLGNLTDLQTLSAFLVDKDDGRSVRELKNLNGLGGALRILRLENVLSKADAKAANLPEKKRLQRLDLRWTSLFVENIKLQEDILDSLRPHSGLKELQILFYNGSKLPTWLSRPSVTGLVVMTLYKCENCERLPSFGRLPELKFLSIVEMNKVKEIDGTFFRSTDDQVDESFHAFPKLEILEIDSMLNLIEWKEVKEGDLPALIKLTMESCPELVTLPSFSSLKCLQYFEVSHCRKLVSLDRNGLPTSPESLIIRDCPKLEWCDKEGDQDLGLLKSCESCGQSLV